MKHATPSNRVSDVVSRDDTNRRTVIRESTVMEPASAEACLRACHVGRLLRKGHSEPIIDVVGYSFYDNSIYFYAPGESLLALTNVGVDVMFEVDRVDDRNGAGWSIVVQGSAAAARGPVPDAITCSLRKRDAASDHVDDLVRITIGSIVGRRYV